MSLVEVTQIGAQWRVLFNGNELSTHSTRSSARQAGERVAKRWSARLKVETDAGSVSTNEWTISDW